MKLENSLRVLPIPSKIAIAQDVDPNQEEALKEALKKDIPNLECVRFDNTKDQGTLTSILNAIGADIAVTRTSTIFGKEALEGSSLQAVQGACKGPHVDKDAAHDEGIEVLKVDSNREQVVNLTLATLDGMATGLLLSNNMGRQGKWGKEEAGRAIFDLREQRLGIVGYGDIGRRLAERARSQGMSVWTYSHRHELERQYDRDLAKHIADNGVQRATSLEELLAMTNILSLHIDETDAHGRSNKGFITPEILREWSPQGPKIFLNIGRGDLGPTLEELNALLKEGAISYAMVDAHRKALEAEGKFQLPDEVHPGLITSAHLGGSGGPVTRRTSVDVAASLKTWITTGGFPETRVYVHEPLRTQDLLPEGLLGLRLARTTASGIDGRIKVAIQRSGFEFRGGVAIDDLIPGKRPAPGNDWRVVPHVLALEANDHEAAMMDLIKGLDSINSEGRKVISARFIPTTPEMGAMIRERIE